MQAQATAKTEWGASKMDRETVADMIGRLQAPDTGVLAVMMDNPAQDDVLLDGLHLYLDRAAQARFLHTLKLEQCGLWFGNTAPARLQMRIAEAGRSSQHAAYQAFRVGLKTSGGLERAYPKA